MWVVVDKLRRKRYGKRYCIRSNPLKLSDGKYPQEKTFALLAGVLAR
jgi:hypothetical protein